MGLIRVTRGLIYEGVYRNSSGERGHPDARHRLQEVLYEKFKACFLALLPFKGARNLKIVERISFSWQV